MPFIPHTADDIQEMLNVIGIDSTETLFDEIPSTLKITSLPSLQPAQTEAMVSRIAQQRAAQDGAYLNFIGAGAYEHHIPAAVGQIIERGEFYSAYTPYQAEASQGTLQVLYEFQTMVASLMGLEAANASLYDGASAVAEAIMMAIRHSKEQPSRILVPGALHPHYRQTLRTLLPPAIELIELPFCHERGQTLDEYLDTYAVGDFVAMVIAQPNFFGIIEEVDTLTNWAHAHNMLVIAVVNPMAMTLLKPPGEWGQAGADIAVGEGQPLGIPLSSGGPYLGLLAAKISLIRQMPGRIVGRTTDADNRPCFTLTLQAREQHIRRAKATSNICTNQGLMVTAATIYLSLLGTEGLNKTILTCHQQLQQLRQALCAIEGVNNAFTGPTLHECVITLPVPVAPVLEKLQRDYRILGGYNLSQHYPELGHALLICATDLTHNDDILTYQDALRNILN